MTRFTVVFAGLLDGKRLEDFTIDGATAVAYWGGDAIRQQVCFQDFIAEIDDLNGKIEDLSAENARLREAMEEYVNTVVKMEGVTFVDQMENAELRAVVESVLAEQGEKP